MLSLFYKIDNHVQDHLLLFHHSLIYTLYFYKLRARTCLKCKEYVLIHPNNSNSIKRVNIFEKIHRSHTFLNTNVGEIKDKFTIF